MPRDLLRVETIHQGVTTNPGTSEFDIRGFTADERPTYLRLRTINEWKAAVCERAKATGALVWMTWRDGRFGGKEIVTVSIASSQEHDPPAA